MPTDINKGANIKEAEIREFTWLNFDENKFTKLSLKKNRGRKLRKFQLTEPGNELTAAV